MRRRLFCLALAGSLAGCAGVSMPRETLPPEQALHALAHGASGQERRKAALALGRWLNRGEEGEEAALPALNALSKAARQDGAAVAEAALWAWGKGFRAYRGKLSCAAGNDAAGARGVAMAGRRGEAFGRAAAIALAQFPACAISGIPALGDMVDAGESLALKRDAAWALSLILAEEWPRGQARALRAMLDRAQRHDDEELRLLSAQGRVAMAIGLPPRADMAEEDKLAQVAALAVRAADVGLRAAAIRVMGQLEMGFALPAIEKGAASKEEALRLASVDAMVRQGDGWEYFLPCLRVLSQEDASLLVRRRASLAWKTLAPQARR